MSRSPEEFVCRARLREKRPPHQSQRSPQAEGAFTVRTRLAEKLRNVAFSAPGRTQIILRSRMIYFDVDHIACAIDVHDGLKQGTTMRIPEN